MEDERRRRFLVNVAYWAVILAIIYLVFKYLINLVMPFFLALIFSSLLRPLVKLMVKKLRLGKSLSAVLSTALLFALICGLIVLLGGRFIGFLADVFPKLPGIYTSTVAPGLAGLMASLETFAERFDPSVVEFVSSVTPQLISAIGNFVTNISVSVVSSVSGFATRIPGYMLKGVITVIATVFMAIDYERIAAFLMRQLPERAKQLALDVKDCFVQIIFRYGKSYALIMLITFGEICIGLLLIGVKRAPLIALLIAIFDIFPIVGAGMVLLPWSVVCFIQGLTARGVGIMLLYVVVVVLRQIIEPRIIGRHVGLHPLVTLVGMVVGTSLFGGLGLFGVPIMMAIVVNLNETGAIHLFRRAEPEEDGGA